MPLGGGSQHVSAPVFVFFAVDVREEIILTEPVPPSPSPVPFSPAKSATSVDMPSAPSPVSNQSPEYVGIATTTGW